jgi:amidophosphoribosyltransferase
LLAKKFPIEADIVSPIPNSGRWHAIGYAKESKIPYEDVFVRYDYSDRSYTPGEQVDRDQEARDKLIPVSSAIKGNRIIIVDDSIVRGTQTLNQVERLRQLGAKEVHAMIACPPLMDACNYGKSTKKDEDCIARRMSLEDLQERLKLDSLNYATVEILEGAMNYSRDKLCLDCWGS